MEGDSHFEYQISADDSKSWFDAVRTCKVRNTVTCERKELLSSLHLNGHTQGFYSQTHTQNHLAQHNKQYQGNYCSVAFI